ncbi:MAG: PDZ domain-containing protein [Thermoleophilia bacterium]|nr:PDZ domain-containing protein [Thermoleophilia bacterium]
MAWLRSPVRLAAAALVVTALAAAALLLTPAGEVYIVLPDRARPVDPLIEIADLDAEGQSRIYFVNVVVRRATLLERWVPAIRDGADVVPAHAINPAGVSEAERRRRSLREMSRSQRIAAAVALRELGDDVRVTRTGARVEALMPGRPAAAKLRAGDVLLAVDGERVTTPEQLRGAIGRRRPGDSVTLRLRRGTRTLSVRVRLAENPREAGRAIIGVLVAQEADIDLPRRVEIDSGGIGGPSAGLAFALGLLEELGRDVDQGRRIAVTGALDLDGNVVSVGGVKQKTIGVREAGIDIFVVPAGENAAEARANADGVRIIPAKSFQQTLQTLATLPAHGG